MSLPLPVSSTKYYKYVAIAIYFVEYHFSVMLMYVKKPNLAGYLRMLGQELVSGLAVSIAACLTLFEEA